jgi:hypothetical protein
MNPPCTSASACALTPLNAMNNNPVDPRRKTRTTHSISFKIDVCEYWRRIPNPTVAGCARHYAITEKKFVILEEMKNYIGLLKIAECDALPFDLNK